MAKDFSLLLLHLHLLFWVPNVFFTAGVSVNFSLNAENSDLIWTATDLGALVKELKPSSIGIWGYVGDHDGDFSFHLLLNSLELKELHRSKPSTIVLLKSKLLNLPPHVRTSWIIISGNDIPQSLLLPTLQSVHFAVRSLRVDHTVKVFPVFSLSLLENLSMAPAKKVEGLVNFLRKSKSFLVVGVPIDSNLSWKSQFDQFLQQIRKMVIDIFQKFDVPLVLKDQFLVTSNGIEISEHMETTVESLEKHSQLKSKIHGIMLCISSGCDLDHRKQVSKRKNHISSSYRILLEKNSKPKNGTKATIRDIFTPITNPATTPSTPSGFVTIPSTNPVTILPTNPTIPDITVPSTIPPSFVPVTNPVTTPTTNFPFPPSFVVPGGNIPGSMPMSPSISGQIWCVVKPGVPDAAIQMALDYACGIGGADCLAIQQTGGCYNPNTIQDHASYAFNSYYQKSPTPPSCDFGGIAMLVSTNPSSGTCVYPASSSNSPVLNPGAVPDASGGSTSIFGSNNPFGSSSPIISEGFKVGTTDSLFLSPVSATVLALITSAHLMFHCIHNFN